jgi:hypothetical protein
MPRLTDVSFLDLNDAVLWEGTSPCGRAKLAVLFWYIETSLDFLA